MSPTSVHYIKVKWSHNSSDEPTLLYSELGDDRREVRKVEVFPNGTYGFASEKSYEGTTRLGDVPVPPYAEIAAQPEFELEEISQDEFEAAWTKAVTVQR